LRAGVVRLAADVAIDSAGVRPVTLDQDSLEAMLGDQLLGQEGPGAVELVAAVAGLAEEDDAARSQALGQLGIALVV
jgi:hypothetical protein